MCAKEGGSTIFGSAATTKITPSAICTRIVSQGWVSQFMRVGILTLSKDATRGAGGRFGSMPVEPTQHGIREVDERQLAEIQPQARANVRQISAKRPVPAV